ncbi:hypothetical protein DPMN_091477 [Dreissena polymorpha]|uniref:Uncharacterized protein n=1 Tax=Dreissena polymorpha TaxID=45954 RepID=A0A9D4L0K6_DREPO|nr:hypothetical protein DPMN_091477 [Dreissena polymorpha]
MQVRDSNPGHLAYRGNALPTKLTGSSHILLPKPLKFGTVTFSPAKSEFVIELDEPTSKFNGELSATCPTLGAIIAGW